MKKRSEKTTTMKINVNDVAETAFLTLYCHALDAQSKSPILNDSSSLMTTQALTGELMHSDKTLHRMLVRGKVARKLVIHTAIRAKKYDRYALDFIRKYPKATIVNIGCGLDNRFERINNGKIEFYDLDLPDIMEIKKQFFKETKRYHQISQSVFDFSWMERIKKNDILFLAEGVLMYCEERDVKSLFIRLQNAFPGSDFVCEVVNSMWLNGWLKKITNFKMRREFHFGKDASFHFGIRSAHEIETWSKGIKLLGEWSYLESDETKLKWLKNLKNLEAFSRAQWTAHFRLNSQPCNKLPLKD